MATKKATTKKSPAKKAATKKAATTAKKTSTAKKTTAAKKKKAPAKKAAVKKAPVARKLPNFKPMNAAPAPAPVAPSLGKPKKLPVAFLRKQEQKLLDLRDQIVDQMNGVARETLRGSGDGSESAFGMHQADAGTDSYDRDFALNLLSKEQDALEEIDKALKRIEAGTYGICEESGEAIPQPRLEAMPFARMTVACQERNDQQESFGPARTPVTSLFGLEDKDKKVTG